MECGSSHSEPAHKCRLFGAAKPFSPDNWAIATVVCLVGGAIVATLNYYGVIDIPDTWEEFWK